MDAQLWKQKLMFVGRSISHTFEQGIKFVADPFGIDKKLDPVFEEKRESLQKLNKLCADIQTYVNNTNHIKKTLSDPLSNLSVVLTKFKKDKELSMQKDEQQMKSIYSKLVEDLNIQITLLIGRQRELKNNIESSLPKLDLLRKRVQERDVLATEYESCRLALKSATEKNLNIHQFESKLVEITTKFEPINTSLIKDIEEYYTIFYNSFQLEFQEISDTQARLSRSIQEIHKQLDKPTFPFFRKESPSQEVRKNSSKEGVIHTKLIEELLTEEEQLLAEGHIKTLERQKKTQSEDYEGRVVPLCKICKKEVPIEFIDEHSEVCSASHNESENVEEAMWVELMDEFEESQFLPQRKKFVKIKKLMRTIGVPAKLRGKVWPLLVRIALRKNNRDNPKYEDLLKDCGGKETHWADEVERDIRRTFPKEEFFQSEETLNSLRNVLNVYAYYNPSIGYCQSMNFIVALLLFHLSEEDAFWTLVIIIEEMLPDNYYTKNMWGIQSEQQAFKHMLAYYFPKISNHLKEVGVDIDPIICRWFLCLFVSVFPLEGADRLFELFLYEGDIMLYRFGLALFRMHEQSILATNGVFEMFAFLQNITKITNYKKLIRLAYHMNVKKSQVEGLRVRYLGMILKEEKDREEKRLKMQAQREADKREKEKSLDASPVQVEKKKEEQEEQLV